MTACIRETDAQRLARQLADAEDAFHKLKLGRLSVEVEVDGRRVRYERTNADALESYCASLRDKVNGRRPSYGAIGFVF